MKANPASQDVAQLAAVFTFFKEARWDDKKRLKVYELPAADGGGAFEVAGINDGYHPFQAQMLREMIQTGRAQDAETYAKNFIRQYCDVAAKWGAPPAVEFFLRDCVFNRGPKGALRILQLALRVAPDGKFGPITQAALTEASKNPRELLRRLRMARERYEDMIAPPVGQRAKFWKGLVNRWDEAALAASALL